MPDPAKFRWAERVSRRDIQRLYESDARGLLDEELLDRVHYAVHARVCDMMQVHEAQACGRVTCRQCGATLAQPYRMGSRHKGDALHCEACGWSVTCGEFYESYTGKSLLPGSVPELFEHYLERFPTAETPHQKLLLIDWLIHQFHMMQGVAQRPAGHNVIQGNTEEVRALIESLAAGPQSTEGLASLEAWRAVYYDPVRLFKQQYSHAQVQSIAARLGIVGRSRMTEDKLIPEILRRKPELAMGAGESEEEEE